MAANRFFSGKTDKRENTEKNARNPIKTGREPVLEQAIAQNDTAKIFAEDLDAKTTSISLSFHLLRRTGSGHGSLTIVFRAVEPLLFCRVSS
jgi:hypothetical protein